MKYRRLGKSGLTVSVVGVGTWQLGGEWGKDFSDTDASAILGRAEELGINLIDTAECYGDHVSEELIGKCIKGNRDRWIVATKFGHTFHQFMERSRHFDPAHVSRQLDSSLRALQTDYIDLYQLHSGNDEEFDQSDLWEMLHREIKKGRIRHLGLSIGSNRNIYQTDGATRAGADVIQVVYNRLEQGPENEVFPSCIRQDLGVLARVPLSSGYLSGKYAPGATFGPGDVRSKHDTANVAEKLRKIAHIAETEVPVGVEMAQWALAWCLRHEAVTAVIPGCKSPEQVTSNAKAAEILDDTHPLNCPAPSKI